MKRAYHTSVCLDYNGEHPQLLVIGGMDGAKRALSDVWILDIQSERWMEVRTIALWLIIIITGK